MIVNATSREIRVAFLEDAVVVELFIEQHHHRSLVGNIYKGRVTKILPGIQAAFVDIGLPKAGFLYVSDIHGGQPDPAGDTLDQALDAPSALHPSHSTALTAGPPPDRRIEELLEAGQELLVQITKEPLGTKGCRLTSVITLPGRYLVLLPGVHHIGVSRRILEEAEKARVRELAASLLPAGMGCIVRTLGAGATSQELRADVQFLTTLWHDVQRSGASTPAPYLVHQELNLLLRILRDLLADNVDHCFIDDPAAYARAQAFVRAYFPHLAQRLVWYQDPTPIFDAFGVERQIAQALQHQIRLTSGGYITIDHTEALVAIDVNTGRYIGTHHPAETILTTNLEAVDEVARQLRLRNIGGLIIIDFIDMDNAEHKARVVQRLEDRLQRDRARTKVLSISDFGLVEMTRQRMRASLSESLCKPCPCCGGTGLVETPTTVCAKIFREIYRIMRVMPYAEHMTINVHPAVANWLHNEENAYVSELESHLRIRLTIKADDTLRQGQFEVLPF
jgi:ribonuclease G